MDSLEMEKVQTLASQHFHLPNPLGGQDQDDRKSLRFSRIFLFHFPKMDILGQHDHDTSYGLLHRDS